MPLTLPPELRNRLLARFEGPDARAFKLVEQIGVLKWSPDRWPAMFRKSWEESADHQRLFLKGRLMAYAPWDEQDEKMVRQWLAYISERTEASSLDPQRFLELNQLISTFSVRYMTEGKVEARMKTMNALCADVRQAIGDFGDVDKKGDLPAILISCLEVMSLLHERNNDFRKALTSAETAIRTAEEFGLPDRAMTNRCRCAKLMFDGSRDIDNALHLVLPVWETAQNGTASLERAQLAYELAKGYAQTGDLTETRHFLEAAMNDLLLIGAGFDGGEPVAVLTAWVAALPAWEPKANYTFDKFHSSATLHSQYAALRKLYLPMPEGNEAWRVRGEHCIAIIGKVQELQEYQTLVDAHLLAGEPIPVFTATERERIDHAAVAYDQWTTMIRNWFERDGKDDKLLIALRIKLREEAIKKDTINQMLIWQYIGQFHYGRDETKKSTEALTTALGLAAEANRLKAQLHILELMVDNYAGPGQIRERLDVCLRAIDLIEAARLDISTPYQRSAFVQDKYHFYALALKICWQQQNPGLMLGLMELVKANGYRDALPREGEEAGALRAQLDALHGERMTAAPESLPAITRRRQMLYDTLLLRNRTQREPTDYRSALSHLITDAPAEGEAVLNYCELIGGIWLCQLFVGGRFLAHELRVDEAWLNDRIASFGTNFPSGYRGRAMTGYTPKYGRRPGVSVRSKQQELAEWLLPPEFMDALKGCRHLRICPHHELHAVPFHALPYEDGYLIGQFAVSYLPNLSCLPLPPPERGAVGAVALIGTDQFARFDGHDLAPLPGALAEVNELAAFYEAENVQVLNFNGNKARRANILDPAAVQALRGARIVHLAVHGEDLSSESPMDARLFLRDGFIDGFDISLLHLTAEVVVLSACFAGARPQEVRGFEELVADDMYGLQSAFFSAGARSVLGALWPVEDEAGKLLMVDFHRFLREHPPAEALRLATLAYLESAPEKRRESVYWGSFFLVEG